MSFSFCFTCCAIILSFNFGFVFCGETTECNFVKKPKNDDEYNLVKRLSALYHEKYEVVQNSDTYRVSICGDVSANYLNGSVVLGKDDKNLVVLGRRNDSQITGGVSWIMLLHGSGDISTSCPTRRTSILIICDPTAAHHTEQSHDMVLLPSTGPCVFDFLLSTPAVCVAHATPVSGFGVFMIILVVLLFLYFAGGVLYRRMAFNSQGCRQLPHFAFWSKFGALCADGCNYACRCGDQREDSWNTITSNLDAQDRDDALLRP